ncbi:MAG: HAMP domain-containing sensor histidine kinase [Dehalococcoidia bacterium]
MPGVLFSLQTKLIVTFVAVVLVALFVAGSLFVVLRRGEQEEQELDHVIATSPAIYGEFNVLQRRGDPEAVLAQFAQAAAEDNDVRIVLLDRTNGTVAYDTGGDLAGEEVVLPEDIRRTLEQPVRGQPYVSWKPEAASGVVLVSAVPSRLVEFRQIPPRGAELYWLVLAVPEDTVTGAWLDLLPGLGVAAAVALPIAALLGVLVAQYITRPLQQLTAASQRMAEGTFDVRVSIDRRDEVGRLAQAFSTMAERVGEAHEQMRALVANVSHDLKTPLTSILGFAQALRDGESDEQARHMGEVIHDEASRLNARLNDLLYLSELESGQALIERDEVDLRRLLEDAVERVQQTTDRGVQLTADLADGVTLSADGAKLERALENLLDNARKYAPSASEVHVRSFAENGQVCIEVANAAPELSADELPRLFDRFYRRDRARGQSPGSGLGLPIARDLVELHGGTLEAALRDGEVVFSVRLPARA